MRCAPLTPSFLTADTRERLTMVDDDRNAAGFAGCSASQADPINGLARCCFSHQIY
jgi:hypothetical protein